MIENNILEQVDNTKFLGVYIDQHLTWKTHVNFITAKISKSVGLLYKAKYYLPSKSLLTLYYALVYPYLTYCNLIWASTYVTNLQRIYLLQKRRGVTTLTNVVSGQSQNCSGNLEISPGIGTLKNFSGKHAIIPGHCRKKIGKVSQKFPKIREDDPNFREDLS